MSEEKFGVSVHGSHDVRGGDDLSDFVDLATQGLWLLHAPHVPEWIVPWNASTGECVEVGTMPLVWEITWVIGAQFTSEWPDRGSLFVSVLVVVR